MVSTLEWKSRLANGSGLGRCDAEGGVDAEGVAPVLVAQARSGTSGEGLTVAPAAWTCLWLSEGAVDLVVLAVDTCFGDRRACLVLELCEARVFGRLVEERRRFSAPLADRSFLSRDRLCFLPLLRECRALSAFRFFGEGVCAVVVLSIDFLGRESLAKAFLANFLRTLFFRRRACLHCCSRSRRRKR